MRDLLRTDVWLFKEMKKDIISLYTSKFTIKKRLIIADLLVRLPDKKLNAIFLNDSTTIDLTFDIQIRAK